MVVILFGLILMSPITDAGNALLVIEEANPVVMLGFHWEQILQNPK